MSPSHFAIIALLWKYSCIHAQTQQEANFARKGCDYLNLEGTNLYRQSLENCKNSCSSRDWCKAINYFRKEQKCSLLGTNNGQGESTSTRSCVHKLKDATWNVNTTGCGPGKKCNEEIVKECQPFGPLSNAVVLGNMHLVGSRQRIKCNEGYTEITGSDRSECLSTGNWSHYPRCSSVGTVTEDHCGDPEIHENATLSSESNVHGSRTTYTCNKGFGVNGSSSDKLYTISCVHGSWTNVTAKCSGLNCDGIPLAHASFSDGGSSHGSSRAYTCDVGFSIDQYPDNNMGVAVCSYGDWNTEGCKEVTPTFGTTCQDSNDCVETESICVNKSIKSNGTCFCSPMFRYNSSLKNCVKVCTNITDDFTVVNGTFIKGYNDRSGYRFSCHELCIASSRCMSYEKNYNKSTCNINIVSIEMITDADRGAIGQHEVRKLFSRICV